MSSLLIPIWAIPPLAHADCPIGFNNNEDINVSTGVIVYFCTPIGVDHIAQYDSNLTPNAIVATPEISSQITLVPDTSVTPQETALLAPIDPNDPLPNLAFGEQLPGTTVEGDVVISCPIGAGRGIDINVKTGALTSYCVKTYITPDPLLMDATASPVPSITDTVLSVENSVIDVSVTSSADVTPLKLGGLAGTSARGD